MFAARSQHNVGRFVQQKEGGSSHRKSTAKALPQPATLARAIVDHQAEHLTGSASPSRDPCRNPWLWHHTLPSCHWELPRHVDCHEPLLGRSSLSATHRRSLSVTQHLQSLIWRWYPHDISNEVMILSGINLNILLFELIDFVPNLNVWIFE